jgi:hypothetical protein
LLKESSITTSIFRPLISHLLWRWLPSLEQKKKRENFFHLVIYDIEWPTCLPILVARDKTPWKLNWSSSRVVHATTLLFPSPFFSCFQPYGLVPDSLDDL